MSMTPQAAYNELIDRVKKVACLGSCAAVLGWDQETYMPTGGAANRAEQLSLLAGMCHEQATDPRLGELLGAVEGTDLVSDPQSVAAVNVRELRHDYDRQVKLPKRLVEELTHTSTLAQVNWVEARQQSNFARFAPWLEKIVRLVREVADAYGYEENPYDALLEDYERGVSTRWVEGILAPLRVELVKLLDQIKGSKRAPDAAILARDYPLLKQETFGRLAATAIGYDFRSGRLDVSAHPFTTSLGPGDTRITTRYQPRRFNDAFFSIMHETGHALYDQGMPREHWGTPMGAAVSLGIHESQSRLWENMVGRGKPFWRYFFPIARQFFPEALGDVVFDDFHGAINAVAPSFIRVDADEVTYNLHIILRFELEQAMLRGDLKAADVPVAWNEKFQASFGLTPPDDARGCLQDVHWSHGAIGYFPTYTLGNLNAAQFFEAARVAVPGLEEGFARGDFAPLLGWLRQQIHGQGQRYRAAELCRRVTGKPLCHDALVRHLRAKLTPLYGL